MKNKVVAFRLVVILCSVCTVLAAAIECGFFRAPGISFYDTFSRIVAIGVPFCAIVVAVSFKWVGLYRFNFHDPKLTMEQKIASLQGIGKIPLEFFGIFTLLVLAYLAVLGSLSGWIGLYPGLTVPILSLCFAWGLVGAAGIYNFSDKINIGFILNQKIVDYPRALRERRQQSKAFIIPVFTLFLGLIYALSLGIFMMGKWKALNLIPTSTYVTTLIGLAFFLGLSFYLLGIWSGNLRMVFESVISQLDQLSSGDKNLCTRIHIGSVDEIGTIAGLINGFTADLAGSIAGIKDVQRNLDAIGTDLQRNTEKSSSAVRNITVNMGRMSEKSLSQKASVQEVSTAVQQIAENIASLDRMITDQAASVTEASASVEQMVGNIGSINNSMGAMVRQFAELAGDAQEGTVTQENSVRKISEIAENSKALQDTNKAIASIAAQTNLLAMNAAIEAAHAGDSGMGFAVVADEIRKLAEDSARNSRKINTVLADVQKGISSVVEASHASKKSFEKVAEGIGATDAIVQEFKMAIGEQQEGASQIMDALRQMNDITAQVKNGSSEMNFGSSTILREVSSLRDNSVNIGESVGAMGAGISEVNEEVAQVSNMAETTRTAIGQLERAIASFRTEEA